jgi:CheY-like chemotaxis protein
MTNVSSLRVLLVDDNDTDNLIGKRIIEISKFAVKVDVINSAKKALEFLEQHMQNADQLPDVLFLDINMPIIDGFEFLERFEKMSETIKNTTRVVILSSSDSEKDIERIADNPRVIKFITKPLKQHDLDEIRSQLEASNP